MICTLVDEVPIFKTDPDVDFTVIFPFTSNPEETKFPVAVIFLSDDISKLSSAINTLFALAVPSTTLFSLLSCDTLESKSIPLILIEFIESLLILLISLLTSAITTLFSKTVPSVNPLNLFISFADAF